MIANTHAHTQPYIPSHMRAHVHTPHAYTHANIPPSTHTCTNTIAKHTHIHTHTHTGSRTHTPITLSFASESTHSYKMILYTPPHTQHHNRTSHIILRHNTHTDIHQHTHTPTIANSAPKTHLIAHTINLLYTRGYRES